MNRLLIILVLLEGTACGNRAMYDNLRLHQRNQCYKEPPSNYEACMERANKSYEKYERERNELLEK